MQVCFRDNLGSKQAAQFGLDFRQCLRGAEHDVSDALGERLVKAGIAVITSPPAIDTAAAPPDVTTSAPTAPAEKPAKDPEQKPTKKTK